MSPTPACYMVAKIESETGDDLGTTRAAGMKQFGIRKQEKVSSPVHKVSRESHRIRKPPLPLPQVQYRPPIIIHTYSPKVIHTEPDDFMSLVQKLTGSSDTRLRLKKSPTAKEKKARSVSEPAPLADPEQQGSKTTTDKCGSPSSSEDHSFLTNSEVCVEAINAKQSQSHSPRSPLSNFEFDSQVDFPFASPFDPYSHVKVEPSFSFNDNSFNFFTDFTKQKPAAPKQQDSYSPFHSSSIDINSPLLMGGLPDLSPPSASWSQSFLDSYLTSSFTNQPPLQRQRFYPSASSEGTMVALENIQAFMLT